MLHRASKGVCSLQLLSASGFSTWWGGEGRRGDVKALGFRHAVSAKLLDRGTFIIYSIRHAIVRVERCFAKLRGHVLDEGGRALEQSLGIIAGGVGLGTELCQDVDEAVRAPIDHREALPVLQTTFADRFD